MVWEREERICGALFPGCVGGCHKLHRGEVGWPKEHGQLPVIRGGKHRGEQWSREVGSCGCGGNLHLLSSDCFSFVMVTGSKVRSRNPRWGKKY